jgi:hypothetical protein
MGVIRGDQAPREHGLGTCCIGLFVVHHRCTTASSRVVLDALLDTLAFLELSDDDVVWGAHESD